MAVLYIPVGSEGRARAIARAIYELGQPASARPEDYRTEQACNVLVHPVSGEVRLEVDEAQRQPIHEAADASGLAAVLDETPQDELDALLDLLQSKKNSFVLLGWVIPSNERAQALTRAEMQSAGWFRGLHG